MVFVLITFKLVFLWKAIVGCILLNVSLMLILIVNMCKCCWLIISFIFRNNGLPLNPFDADGNWVSACRMLCSCHIKQYFHAKTCRDFSVHYFCIQWNEKHGSHVEKIVKTNLSKFMAWLTKVVTWKTRLWILVCLP